MKFPFGSRLSIYPLALLLVANLRAGQTAPASAEEGPDVLRAAKDLQADTNRMTPTLTTDRAPVAGK